MALRPPTGCPKNVFFGVATGKPSGRAIPDAPSAYRGAPRPTKIGFQRNPVELKPFEDFRFLHPALIEELELELAAGDPGRQVGIAHARFGRTPLTLSQNRLTWQSASLFVLK